MRRLFCWGGAILFPCFVWAAIGYNAVHIEIENIDAIPVVGKKVLDGVPEYCWYYGCSPTAGGMIIGYWDSHPSGKWANLVDGDVSIFNDTAKNMIASKEHLRDYWGTPDPNPGGHPDNCIADFMHTSRSEEGLPDGGTWNYMIPRGLQDFARWDNPDTAINESYNAESWREGVDCWGGSFSWEAFKEEIDAGYPMLLDVYTCTSSGCYAHSVVGYGYQEDMFNLKIPVGEKEVKNITVGGFAVMDTWCDGNSSGSEWLDWNSEVVLSYIDNEGREWWPFLDMSLTGGWFWEDLLDWQVFEGIYFHPGEPIAEPLSGFLLGTGLLGLAGIRIRRKK